MKNKFTSLIIVLLIYLISIGIGIVVFYILKDSISNGLLLLLICDLIITVLVFMFGVVFDNASVYDPYWSVIPLILVLGFYYYYEFLYTHLIVLIPLLFWSIRLTYNWIMGFDNLLWQDWRYVKFKNDFPKIYLLIWLGGVMIMPTLLVFCGMIPIYNLISEGYNLVFLIVGGTIIMFAAVYQMIADLQLKKFKKVNSGKIMNKGLWKLSRHPNYFGEVFMWFGVFISSLGVIVWTSFIGIVLIICLFYFISVPLMEKHMIGKYDELYINYQREVKSKIIPFLM